MIQVNLPMKKEKTHRENRLVAAKGEGMLQGGTGMGRCRQLPTEWMSKAQLYATGKYSNILSQS